MTLLDFIWFQVLLVVNSLWVYSTYTACSCKVTLTSSGFYWFLLLPLWIDFDLTWLYLFLLIFIGLTINLFWPDLTLPNFYCLWSWIHFDFDWFFLVSLISIEIRWSPGNFETKSSMISIDFTLNSINFI